MLRFDRVTTPRLVLRRWQPGDLDSFAALNADPEVMRHFPSTYDRSATAAMITAWAAKIDRQGFGPRITVSGPAVTMTGLYRMSGEMLPRNDCGS